MKNAGGSSRWISSYTPKLKTLDERETYPFIRDIMDHTMVKLRENMPVYEAIEILLAKKITGAAVVGEDDELVGILSEKDCLRVLLQGAYDGLPSGTVKDYMSTNMTTVPSHLDITSAVNIFMRNTYRRLPVVDDGKLVGQITRRDLLRAIQHIIKSKKTGSIY